MINFTSACTCMDFLILDPANSVNLFVCFFKKGSAGLTGTVNSFLREKLTNFCTLKIEQFLPQPQFFSVL